MTALGILVTIVFLSTRCVVKGGTEEDLDDLQQEFSDWLFSENPEFATSINIHKYDDQVDDYSTDVFDRWKTAVDDFHQRLLKIPKDSLSEKYKVDYDIFENFLMTYAEGYKWRDFNALNPINFLEGPQIDPNSLVKITPTESKKHFENFISRIEKLSIQLQQMQTRFERAVTLGNTYHNVSIVQVPNIVDKIPSRPEDFNFYSPFKETLDNIDTTKITPTEKERLRTQAKAAILQYLKGLQNLTLYLRHDYFSHLRQGYGVSSWAKGQEFYKSALQWHLSLPITPEEVHQKGLAEVDRISKQMRKIMTELGYQGTVKEIFDKIKNDSKFHFNTGEQILAKFNEIIHKQIEPMLSLVFKNLPRLPVEVQPMPNDGPGGQYHAGSADGSRPGIFQVNLMHPKEMTSINFVALALHETNPGHHLQISIQQLAQIPDFRRYGMDEKYFQAPTLFPFYTAFVEGWALYAESLGEEMGLYTNKYDLLGRYGSEIFRACRLVVDTGIHYMNWTRNDAIQFMLNYTANGIHDIETEINRYITWPGQACAYKIGELKIRELRNKASSDLGKLFDLKEFHSVVLENGAIPLSTLETIVDNWVDKTKIENEKTFADDLNKLQQEFSDWLFSENPVFATSINIHKYDDEVDDYSTEIFDRWQLAVGDYQKRLFKIPRAYLSEKHRIDYDVFKNFLTTYLEGNIWRDFNSLNPINFLEGPYIDPNYLVSIIPKDTRGDFDNFISRIEKLPKQLEQMQSRFERAVQLNHTYHTVSIAGVPDIIDNRITSRPEDFSYYSPFNETLDNITKITAAEKARLRQQARNAISMFFKGLLKLKTYLTNNYVSNLRHGYGVGAWDKGPEFYKAVLQWHLSLPLTPEDVHKKGLDEVERISKEMTKIMAELGYRGTVKEVFDQIKNDSRFYFKTGEEILDRFNNIIHKEIQPKLSLVFKNLPDLPVEVQPMPNDGPGGQYIAGSADGSRPGVFQVNLMHPSEMISIDFMALSLHETNPGHHLQISVQQLANIPDFRRYGIDDKYFQAPALFPFYTSFVEGWALYAESLGEEMGLYKNKYDLLGRYGSEIFRACRLVVDTGIHYMNWTRDDAIQFMLNYTAYGIHDIETEINRYITWPGQACAYKIGELKIKELRNKAATALGQLFDLKEFHSVVLENGPIPLSTLETIVDNWIQNVKADTTIPSEHPTEDLRKLQKEFSDWLLSQNPAVARSNNIHIYDTEVRDYSLEAFDNLKGEVDKYLQKLQNIQRGVLSKKNQVDYDIFKDTLQTYHDGYQWRLYTAINPVNFLEGPQMDPDWDVSVLPKNMTVKDFENFITRIEKFAIQNRQFKNRIEKAISVGHTNHNVSMFSVSNRFMEINITGSPENFSWYKPFLGRLDNITSIEDAKKAELRKAGQEAIKIYLDSMVELKDFIQNVYMKNLRGGFGVSAWDQGVEFYKASLRWHLSLPLSPEEVHEKGISEVDRIATKMRTIFDKLNLTGTVKYIFDSLKNNTKFLLKRSNDILSKYKDIVHNRIEPKLKTLFKKVPSLPVEVRPTLTDAIGGSYVAGPPDGSRPGIFYVNTFHPDESPIFNFADLSLHEAIPGHHLQISYQSTAKIPGFRQWMGVDPFFMVPAAFPQYSAFVEGWALYAESLGEEMDVFQNDYELLGRYSAEIFRACRLVVDTGLHYYNWTRERAINYMLNYTAYGLSDITTEINRYITWPGQACAYKIGELKIRELREKAEQILGKKFDIKNFHFVILQNGAMPLTTLESVVDSWISERDSSSSEEEDTPADDLAELQNSFSEWILYENPEFATMINDRRYDDRLDDFSIEAFDRWKDQVDNYLDELYNIPQESLSPKLQLDYDVFEDFLLTYRDGWEWRMFNALNPINFLEGPQADPETIVKTMPKYTKGNFENFLVRIKQYPKQIQNMKERFQKAIETNHTYHMVSIESVAKRIKAMVKKKPEDFVFYKPFKTDLDKLTSIDKAEKEEMRTRAKAAISKLMTSLDDISTFIEESYQPHVRTGYGVSSWSSGSEFYKACLEWHISLTLTPEQVHQIGLQEVKRISTQMKKIFEKLGITGTIKECFDKLKKDKKYFYKHGKDIVNHFNDVIHGQIEPKLKLLFKDLPNLPVVVEPMPYNGPTGIYLTGSPDGTKPGTFQVNVRHPDELPTFTFMSLALHEAIPGHHTQISVQLLADIPGYRRNGVDSKYFQPPTLFPYYTAFVEGWALYAEFLGEEMGMYKTDEEMLGRYNDEIFRAGRLVVDTGLHYFGWSRDRAIEYMSNFSAAGGNELETEIDRYITWPGQACAYKIGELKIKELRNKASNELGEDFDIRDFHSVVLNNGPMPLKLLEKVVYHWIKDVKKEKEGERERQKAVVVVTKPETSGSWVIHRGVPAVLISSALLLAFYLRQR